MEEYLLLSNSMRSVNEASEKEALSLLDNFFFENFRNAEFLNNPKVKDSDSFKKYLLSGKTDAIHVVLNSGKDRIISFAKILDSDWFMVISIDHDLVMGTRSNSLQQIGKMSMLAIMCIVVVSMLFVIVRESPLITY